MKKNIEDIIKELDDKIPRDAVSARDGGGGRKLSYLEGWYVIDRLNKIFGHLNWNKEIQDVRQVENQTSRGTFPAYLVKVKVTVYIDGKYVSKEAYGYGSDKSSQNAHELAIKEAVTDALKVAAKDFGMSLGLALYDKSQEFVDDGETETRPEWRSAAVRNGSNGKVQESAGRAKEAKSPEQPAPRETHQGTGEADKKEALLEDIRKQIEIARAQKKSDLTKEYFASLGLSGRDELPKLTVEQLTAAKAHLRGIING